MTRRGGGTRTRDAHRPEAEAQERGARANRAAHVVRRAGSTKVRIRSLAVIVLIALVAAPVAARLGVATAHRDRDRARSGARVAAGDRRAARQAVLAADSTREQHEADARKAAQAASDARVALAEAGVSERSLRKVLEEAKADVEAVEAKDQSMVARLDRQARDLFLAVSCIDEVVRVLGRASEAASSGGTSAGLTGSCEDLGRRTTGATG